MANDHPTQSGLFGEPASRRCQHCKQVKSLTEFYRVRTRNAWDNYCKVCRLAAVHESRKRDPERQRRNHQKSSLAKNYGMAVAEYEAMLKTQNGLCAICGKAEKVRGQGGRGTKRLAVDHDHDSGHIRGLLCHTCNRGVGNFYDDPDLLDKAAAYLRLHAGKADQGAAV